MLLYLKNGEIGLGLKTMKSGRSFDSEFVATYEQKVVDRDKELKVRLLANNSNF